MAVIRRNFSLDPLVYEEFTKYATKQGIKTSTWINLKMIEFIEEQKALEEKHDGEKHTEK